MSVRIEIEDMQNAFSFPLEKLLEQCHFIVRNLVLMKKILYRVFIMTFYLISINGE